MMLLLGFLLGLLFCWVSSAEARYDLGISYEFGRQVIHTDSDSVVSLINAKLFIPWDFLPKNPIVKSTKIMPQLSLGYVPKTRSAIVGAEIASRFYLSNPGKLVPFIDFGAGINYIDDRFKEIGGDFQFSLLGRAGVEIHSKIFPWKATEVSFGMQHYSNGKIVDKPNAGLNYLTLRIGLIY